MASKRRDEPWWGDDGDRPWHRHWNQLRPQDEAEFATESERRGSARSHAITCAVRRRSWRLAGKSE